jgi:hypothetical protein
MISLLWGLTLGVAAFGTVALGLAVRRLRSETAALQLSTARVRSCHHGVRLERSAAPSVWSVPARASGESPSLE